VICFCCEAHSDAARSPFFYRTNKNIRSKWKSLLLITNTTTFRQTVRTIKGYRSLLGKNRRGRWGEHMPEHIPPKNSTPPRRTRPRSFLLDPYFYPLLAAHFSSKAPRMNTRCRRCPLRGLRELTRITARSRCELRSARQLDSLGGRNRRSIPISPTNLPSTSRTGPLRRVGPPRRIVCDTAIYRKLTVSARRR